MMASEIKEIRRRSQAAVENGPGVSELLISDYELAQEEKRVRKKRKQRVDEKVEYVPARGKRSQKQVKHEHLPSRVLAKCNKMLSPREICRRTCSQSKRSSTYVHAYQKSSKIEESSNWERSLSRA